MHAFPELTLPSDYLDSRRRFRELAARLGAATRAYVQAPDHVPPLSTDVAYLGAQDAPALVVIASGTHGVEGYAGAACQLRFLQGYRSRYEHSGLGFLLVHAVNPWGYFHDRRVTQEGVDLNRNFVDFPIAGNGACAYGAWHALLVTGFRPLPRGLWNEIRLLSCALTRERRRKLQEAITAGQYDHPDGLFFGGSAPTASRRTWEDIVQTFARGRRQAFLLDLHTGLGKRGAGELISHLPPSDEKFRQMARWFGGALKSMASGESVSAALQGMLTAAFERTVGAQGYAVGLEFGTCTPLAVLNALRADQWCHNHGAQLPPHMREWVRRKMKAAFAGADAQWHRQVAARFDEVLSQLVRGFSDG